MVPEVTNRSCALAGKQAMLESKTKSSVVLWFMVWSAKDGNVPLKTQFILNKEDYAI